MDLVLLPPRDMLALITALSLEIFNTSKTSAEVIFWGDLFTAVGTNLIAMGDQFERIEAKETTKPETPT